MDGPNELKSEVRDVWECKIGYSGPLPVGADAPMREAVRRAFVELTGLEPSFLFSGWGGSLTDLEKSVIAHQERKVAAEANDLSHREDDPDRVGY